MEDILFQQARGAVDGFFRNAANATDPTDADIVLVALEKNAVARIAFSPAGRLAGFLAAYVPSVDNPTPLTIPQQIAILKQLQADWAVEATV